MARRTRLIAVLLVAVLVGHGLALEWLTQQAQRLAALRLMAAPMLTRMLQQESPAPPPAAAAGSPGAMAPAIATLQSVARSTPERSTTTVADPPVKEVDSDAVASAPDKAVEREPERPPAAPPEPAVAAVTAPEVNPEAVPPVGAAGVDATAGRAAPGLSSASAPPPLDSWPADTRLSYRVGGFFRGELHGNARVLWQREGDGYQTRIDIDLGPVSLVMTSQGQVTAQGLLPKAFEETRTGRRRSVLLQDTRVVLADGSQVARPAGVQDTASQFVELSHRFSSGQQPLEVGASISFWMARPGGVDLWTYDVSEKVTLKLPGLGPVEAFHLKPRPLANPRGNITAEMWFAPTLQYLPVRIKVSLGDAFVDLYAEKIEQR